MTYSVTATYTSEAAKLEGTYPIDMFVVNASLSGWEPLYYVNLNQDVVGFSLNATGNLTNNATIYTGLPIDRGDISTNNTGEIGELSISIPNTDRVIESIIQNRQYLRGREIYVVSGFARHLPINTTLEDETGASFGTTVHGLSLADGSAFIKVSGVDLSPYAGVAGSSTPYKIILKDSTGKQAIGYIAEADTTETLASSILTDGGLELCTGWSQTRGTLSADAVSPHGGTYSGRFTRNATSTDGYFYRSISPTVGKLYKVTCWLKRGDSTNVRAYIGPVGSYSTIGITTATSWTMFSIYWTALASSIVLFSTVGSNGQYSNIDDVLVEEVTHVGTTGVHIVSTLNGSTRNWASIESGFNYNDTSYTFDVYYSSIAANLVSEKYIGNTPDKNAFLKEKMYIDNVMSNEQAVVFNCKSKFNIKNVVLPKRAYYKECTWAIMGNYLGSECDPQDTINTASYPTCDGTLDNCRERHNSARFGGFPSIPRRGIVIV